MEEPRRREENGKVYIDIVETKTYEEKVIHGPFGFKKTVRVEVKPEKPAEEQQGKKKLTKKQKLGIGGLILAGLIGGAAIKAHRDRDEEFDEDYDDDQDIEDVEEDEDDDSSEE